MAAIPPKKKVNLIVNKRPKTKPRDRKAGNKYA
jgi:hypothetical protein